MRLSALEMSENQRYIINRCGINNKFQKLKSAKLETSKKEAYRKVVNEMDRNPFTYKYT